MFGLYLLIALTDTALGERQEIDREPVVSSLSISIHPGFGVTNEPLARAADQIDPFGYR